MIITTEVIINSSFFDLNTRPNNFKEEIYRAALAILKYSD
jgi:hypothetical protein